MKAPQSCPTLGNSMDYRVHGILQARILEWVTFPFSKGSSEPRDWTLLTSPNINWNLLVAWLGQVIYSFSVKVYSFDKIFQSFLERDFSRFNEMLQWKQLALIWHYGYPVNIFSSSLVWVMIFWWTFKIFRIICIICIILYTYIIYVYIYI